MSQTPKTTASAGSRVRIGRRPPSFFALLCLALLGYEGHILFFKESGVPANSRRSGRYAVGEIAGETRVSQTLRLGARGFNRVVVHPRAAGDRAAGQIVFELRELIRFGPERPVFRLIRPAEDVLRESSFVWDFPPIDISSGRRYRLEIRSPIARPGEGITLLATREEGYPEGALFLDGREQWGDLVFETSASGGTAFGNLELTLANQPVALRSRWLLGLALVIYNVALVVFLRHLLFPDLGEV